MERSGKLAWMMAAAVAVGLAHVGCPSPATPKKDAFVANETWCPEGFEVGPQDTCFAIPDNHGAETPILVYLHGPYTGHGSAEEWALVRAAVQRGFAVIVPRGKRGACAWTAELKDHFCWPREPEDTAAIKGAVAEWDKVLWQVEALLEGGTHKRFVLGDGNGGSFAAHLATHGFFSASAWGVLHGGALAPSPHGGEPTSPIVMVTTPSDATTHTKVLALRDQLRRANWPHHLCTRAGGTELTSQDVDIVLRYFKRIANGKRPEAPEGATCEGGGNLGARPPGPDGGAPRGDGGGPKRGPARPDGGAPTPKAGSARP